MYVSIEKEQKHPISWNTQSKTVTVSCFNYEFPAQLRSTNNWIKCSSCFKVNEKENEFKMYNFNIIYTTNF